MSATLNWTLKLEFSAKMLGYTFTNCAAKKALIKSTLQRSEQYES